MNLKPLMDRVLVRPDVDDAKTAGGLYIPDTVKKEKSQMGEIIEVGPGATKETPLIVKKGNRVLFSKYAGNDITIEDVDYIIMRQDDILAIVED